MAARYTYALQVQGEDGRWWSLGGLRDVPMQFGQGYIMARRDGSSPRTPTRLLRSDGKVVDEDTGSREVSIGMVAGWPTPGQYLAAARKAIHTAPRIQDQKDRWEREKSGVG